MTDAMASQQRWQILRVTKDDKDTWISIVQQAMKGGIALDHDETVGWCPGGQYRAGYRAGSTTQFHDPTLSLGNLASHCRRKFRGRDGDCPNSAGILEPQL